MFCGLWFMGFGLRFTVYGLRLTVKFSSYSKTVLLFSSFSHRKNSRLRITNYGLRITIFINSKSYTT